MSITRSTNDSRADAPIRTRLVVLAIACLGLSGGFALEADPAAAQSDADMKKAKKRFQQGRSLYEQGRYLEAAEAFRSAYELSERGALLYNIGRSYEKADKLQQAETFYQRYLESEPEADNAEEVVERIIKLQEKIAARMSSVEITSAQEGRNVFVGGDKKPRCQTPCSVSLSPGEHTITVRGQGMKEAERTVQLGRSESKTLEFKLEKDIQPGALAVSTGGRGGVVTIRGLGDHSLPLKQPIELESGAYRIVVRDSSGTEWSGEVEIQESETTRLTIPTAFFDSKQTSSSGGGAIRRGFAYGLLGASAALVGGGFIMGMQADQTHGTLTSEQRRAGGVNPNLLDKGRTEQRVANILFAAGGGAFLSGGTLFVWDLLSGGEQSSPTEEAATGRNP